jgi:hypothetical protein
MLEQILIVLYIGLYYYTYGTHPIFLKIFYFFDTMFNAHKPEPEPEPETETEIQVKNDSPIVKYEDKYLDYIRNANKEWDFTEIEKEKINEIHPFMTKCIKEFNLEDTNLREYLTTHLTEPLLNDFDSIKDFIEEEFLIKNELKEDLSAQYIINKRLAKLENCYVMEKTPIGNVLMIYDKKLETFKYHADFSIPYRYLEVVGRKYVKTFHCRPLFIDMEEELELFEEKWKKEQEMKKVKEEEVKPVNEIIKKSIFAKFKSYNKDAGTKISMAPPKNNSNARVTEVKENEKMVLKEKANRYSYQGKMANFSFLKKVERKMCNKKLGLSFTDFKNLIV